VYAPAKTIHGPHFYSKYPARATLRVAHYQRGSAGAASSIVVELGEQVKKGDRLLVLEAMKMQSTVYASVEGKVVKKLANVGDKVEAKDLLLVLE
jgi:pyruvate carboxylase